MAYPVSFDNAQMHRRTPQRFINFQQEKKIQEPKSEPPKPQDETPSEYYLNLSEPEPDPVTGKIKMVMTIKKWGETYDKFAKDNDVLDCIPDIKFTYTSVMDDKEQPHAQGIPGKLELDELRKKNHLANIFNASLSPIYTKAQFLRVFFQFSGGKNEMTWQQAKPMFASGDFEGTPPRALNVNGEPVVISSPDKPFPTIMMTKVTRDGVLPMDAKRLPKPGDATPDKPSDSSSSEPPAVQPAPPAEEDLHKSYLNKIVPLERLDDDAYGLPNGFMKLDQTKESAIGFKHIVTQSEWLKGISIYATNTDPYRGLTADQFLPFKKYFELNPEATKDYEGRDLTIFELFDLYDRYGQMAAPGGQQPISGKGEIYYGILGYKENFDPKWPKRGLPPLFVSKPAENEKKTDK
jgi:hypothetical protein